MYLKLAWRNIWRNRRRTVITLSSIAFAVFFACIMQSMQLGSYERMIDNAVRLSTGHLQVHHQGYWDEKTIDKTMTWSDSLNKQLGAIENVQALAPRLESFALAAFGDKTKGILVLGIDPDREEKLTSIKNKVIKGNFFTVNDGALIGEDLANFLKVNVGDTLILISQGYHGANAAGKFPIQGIFRLPIPLFNQQAIYLTLPTAQNFYGATAQITSLSVLVEHPDEMDKVKGEFKNLLSTDDFEVMDWKEMTPELEESIELDYYGGLIMIMVLYFVIGFGIFGTFLMMIKERTHELGVLTAIGMRKWKIEWMVGLEIVMLTLFGVIVGGVVSLPLLTYFYYNPIYLGGNYGETMEKFGMEAIIPFSLNPVIFLRQGVIILVITLILSIYPMFAIHTLNTSKALKE